MALLFSQILTIVNYQLDLPIADFWGEGITSASDGMRVPVGVSALKSDINPHYKSLEKGATMIRSINDRNTAHHIEIVSTNTRDATHTLDGLLYHETNLDIHEQFTDTNGYTDQVFGLMSLLGFNFQPHIRNIKNSQLFSIKPPSEYHNLSEVKRIAYSVQTGKVSSSLILGKLGSYFRKNMTATALKELGRIEKSIFMIDYITNENLRRKITHGLNKTEAINAISIWNAVYLQEAYNYLVKIDPEVAKFMKHISPLIGNILLFLGNINLI